MKDLSEFSRLMARIFRGLRRYASDFAQLDGAGPLGRRHGHLLYELLDGPKTVGDMASHLHVSMSAMSNVAAELERWGLIERNPDPEDRRRVLLSIPDNRLSVVEAYLQENVAPLHETVRKMSPPELAAFFKGLRLFDQELATANERRRDL